MITLVMSTIGCPFLLDALASIRQPPDETLIVLDMIGRQSSDLGETFPLPALELALEQFPWARLVPYYPQPHEWAVQNGCYNVGWRAARNPWVCITHDDVTWNDFDYFGTVAPMLEALRRDDQVNGRRCTGIVLPEYEVANDTLWPKFAPGVPVLTQCVSPVSQIISTSALEEMGGFDEVEGVWYDAHLQAEFQLRDWWAVHLPTPLLKHQSNRTYRANNWGGGGFAANPKWNQFDVNFQRMYEGRLPPFYRTPETRSEYLPITDPRFTL